MKTVLLIPLVLVSVASLHSAGVAAPNVDGIAGCGVAFALACGRQAPADASPADAAPAREARNIAGWKVHVSRELLEQHAEATARALELLEAQLEQIVRVVPEAAVAELQKVPLWVSPEYPGVRPKAEYHPNAGWLREHGRDPAMARGVEFTNVRIFEAETRRMPNFALHELAHAYHHRELSGGFNNPEIEAAYEKAKAGGTYEKVEHWHGDGRPNTFDRAYAMTNAMEYFAESTEAFFARNDFFPFTRDELKRHDPAMYRLLAKLWKVPAEGPKPRAGYRPPDPTPGQCRSPQHDCEERKARP